MHTRSRIRTGAGMALLAALLVLGMVAPAGAASARDVDVIVVLETGGSARAEAQAVAREHRVELTQVYEHALAGFAGSVPEGRLNGLRHDPRVASVELDQQVSIAAQTVPTGVQRIFADDNANVGIDGTDDVRIDVDVAVLDTGIDADHPDLNVHASTSCLYSSGGPPFSRTYSCGAGGDDDHYHGTHVAGTIGAIDDGNGVVGVAPGARLWAVKVLDSQGSGPMSAIVAGIDYVTANAAAIEVANMSLGCECTSTAMDIAIEESVAAGVTFVVAAGNSDKDASTFSPANHPDVITVSALADFDGEPGALGSPTCRTDQDDTLADFSNYGSDVEIAAPGVCILSTYPIEQGSYGTISGTSMASPHVAGAAALLAATSNYTPLQIRGSLVNAGNLDWTDDSGDGIKERLLDVSSTSLFNPATVGGGGGGGGGGGDENAPPTADFTYSCTELSCTFTDDSADGDGSIAAWSWTFGDGGTSSAQNPSHTYAAAGTYTVELTVTDDAGATASTSQSVTVSSTPTGDIELTATGYKVKGVQHADLTWSGATSTNVDVFRDGTKIATTANDGAYTDNINRKGGGSSTYRVCEAGTTTCSNEVTVTF